MDSLRVAFFLADQNPHRDRSLGITRMTECLAREMCHSSQVSITQVVSRSSYRFECLADAVVQLPWRTDAKIGRILGDQLHPLFLRKVESPDVWFYPKGYLPRIVPARRPNVIVVHDTILQWYADYYPHYRSRIDYLYWCRMMRHSIARADHIIAVSETTKAQIQDLCDRFKIESPPITVSFEGSDFEVELPLLAEEKQDFVLHLASSAPHKKTNLLLNWWHELTLAGVDLPPLKLVGGLDEVGQSLLKQCNGIEKLPRLEDPEFRLTMKQARAILIPSEIEGFGLPALEAYYCGTPVCFVEGTSIAELLSGRADRGGFALKSRDSFAAALESVLAMPHSEVMAVRSKLLEDFSMAKFAQCVSDVLCDVRSRAST